MDKFYQNIESAEDCWIWGGALNNKGYGTIYIGKKLWIASRLSYFIHNDDFDNKLFVCHSCDTPSCVNPEHLFLGTARENIYDMMLKGRAVFIGRKKLTMEQRKHPSSSAYKAGCRCSICREYYRIRRNYYYHKNKTKI